jgi:hypothetical protein
MLDTPYSSPSFVGSKISQRNGEKSDRLPYTNGESNNRKFTCQERYKITMKNYRFATLLMLGAITSALLLSACGLFESSSASARTPEEAITEAVRDYLEGQGAPISQMEVQIKQIDGDYARVEIISTDPESPGGFNAFMKREDNVWTTLVAGSGMEQTHVESLGIPESVWPEGWLVPDSDMPATVAIDPETSTGCPLPTDETLLLTDEARGYCLLYPASHTVVQLDSGNTEIVVGELMNHIDPRISITVEDLAGRAIEQVVGEFLAGYEGFEIEQSTLTVAGEEAILLDGIPGQDYYRVVLVPHNGLLYRLDIFPYDENLVDTLPQAEQLYALVVDSFTFTTP